MKKKFTGMLIGLLMVCMSFFAGCSLVEVDNNKYYNSVVSEIKDKQGNVVAEITSRELINGYQNYGYYYEYYNGMTREEAVKETIKLLQNRELTLIKAEKVLGVDKTGKNMEPKEKTYLWEQVANALQENVDYYYTQIAGETEKTEEKTDENAVTFEGYTKNATVETDANGNFVIKAANKEKGVLESYIPSVSDKDYHNPSDHSLLWENLRENNKTGKYFEAYAKYLDTMIAAEKGLGLSTAAKDVFEREIERIYEQEYGNYIITRYTEKLLEESNASAVSAQDILDLYSSKVRIAYTQYVIEGDSSYDSTMSSSANNVYYYKNETEDTKYFSVANILFNKVAGQEGKYEYIVRADDGKGVYSEVSKEIVTKAQLETIIQDNVTRVIEAAQESNNAEIFGNALKEVVFMYNQDPGMLSATANYTIGVDSEGKAVSNFVESFNDAGLKLYANGEGKLGDIEICESDYGVHVLVYTGAYQNLFDGIDHAFSLQNTPAEEGELSPIEVLGSTRVSPMLDKTILDVLYDELYVDKSTQVQEADLEKVKQDYSFTNYYGRIPDVLK